MIYLIIAISSGFIIFCYFMVTPISEILFTYETNKLKLSYRTENIYR